MTKAELIAKIAGQTDLTKKETEAVVNAVFEEIKVAMKSEKVSIAGFGTFETRERAARTGRNPRTGADIEIAAAKIPAFKAGKALKDAVAE